MLRPRLFLPNLLAAAAALLAACGPHPAGKSRPAPVAVSAVEIGAPSGVDGVLATGALKRRREITLSFRVPGVIDRLVVDDGDPVREGEVIASIDPTAVEARARQAKADLDRARRDLERLSGLVERGAISRQQLDAQSNVVSDADAAYQAAAFDRRWADIRAPADGVVLSRLAQAGEVVQAGQGVAVIADETSPLVLRAPLADKDAVRVRLGQPARVTVDALPRRTLTGQVSRIGQQAGAASGEIEIEVTIPAEPGLRSGLIAHAEIAPASGAGPGLARIPAEAVLEASGERAVVMALDAAGGHARRTAVRFAGFDGDDALVAGLPAGVRVITAGAGYVSDGQEVRVIDTARTAGAVR